jgi:hypothetical protein
MSFYATLVYDLAPETPPEARKLLRAELAGRRWESKHRGRLTPSNTMWMKRSAGPQETTDHLHRACCRELEEAVAAVARRNLPIRLLRAWVHVSGAGTFGPIPEDPPAG